MSVLNRDFEVVNELHWNAIKLVKFRLPWLLMGVAISAVGSFMVSRFEHTLSANLSLAFFIPMIVYLSDAVGTQTETMYIRYLSAHRTDQFWKYLFKEIRVGLPLGIILGTLTGLIAFIWLRSVDTALTVGFAMLCNITIAPMVALVIPEILFKEHNDPALGGGPFTTVIQDFVSLLIYFSIATLIIF